MRTIILIFFASNIYAQVPGYLGKRVSINYEPAVFFSFLDADHEFEDLPSLGLNYRSDINVEVVISNSISIVPTFKYLKTKIPNSMVYDEFLDPDLGYNINVAFLGDLHVKSQGFGLELKNYQFKKFGSIAPIGRYYSLALVYLNSTITGTSQVDELFGLPNYEYTSIDQFVEFEELVDESVKYKSYAVIFGKGQQTAIGNDFIIDLSVEIGFNIDMISNYEDLIDNKSGEIIEPSSIENIVNNRVLGTYFLNLKCGFGVFLF